MALQSIRRNNMPVLSSVRPASLRRSAAVEPQGGRHHYFVREFLQSLLAAPGAESPPQLSIVDQSAQGAGKRLAVPGRNEQPGALGFDRLAAAGDVGGHHGQAA